MDKSLELVNSVINTDADYIVVGCSSGPDSMCLLDLLYKNKYKIVCAHVNHKIRKESDEEYTFLENYCKKLNIPFEGLVLDNGNYNESYYRKKRYDFYKSLADKYKSKIIATAHHGDDLIETILMRISRGSNLKGYIGFREVFEEKGYLMIKPLIYYTKDEILEYDHKNNVPYNIDKTNEEDGYTRNRYRHHILPFLKNENENIHKKFLEYSKELAQAKDYIQRVVHDSIKDNYKDKVIDLNRFMKLDDYIKKCELETIFSSIYLDDIDKIKKSHTKGIIDLLKKGNNFKMDLPLGYIIIKEYDKLKITNNVNESKPYDIEIKDEVLLDDGYTIKRISESNEKSNYIIRLNSEDISLPLRVRTRNKEDKMEVKNMNGSKKIKEIFIDEKIDRSIRDAYPIVVDAKDTILWIPGIKKSKFDSDLDKKYDIILKYERKDELNEK